MFIERVVPACVFGNCSSTGAEVLQAVADRRHACVEHSYDARSDCMCPKRRWHEQACRISRHQQPILLACPIPGPILEFYRPVTRPDLLMRVVGSPGAESMLERPDGVSQQGSRPAEQRDPSSRRACCTPWLRLSTAGGWLCPARTCGLEHGFGQPVQPANCGQRGSCCRGVHGARSARDRPVFQPKLPRVRGVCLSCP